MRMAFLSALVVLAVCGSLFADGLAYSLPPDGTWVKYKITLTKYEAWNLRPDEKKGWILEKEDAPKAEELAEGGCVFLVRSVGRQDVKDQPCRWVEIVDNPDEEGKAKPKYRVIILKLLIPEAAFRFGVDPFEKVEKMYIDSTNGDGEHYSHEVKDEDRRNYEVERFRGEFPVPPKDARRKKGVERKTALGVIKGDELEFEYGFEGKLAAGKKGWNCNLKSPYKVVVSDRSPFGVVAATTRDQVSIEEYGDGRSARLTQSWTMEVTATGTGAKSGLPDKK